MKARARASRPCTCVACSRRRAVGEVLECCSQRITGAVSLSEQLLWNAVVSPRCDSQGLNELDRVAKKQNETVSRRASAMLVLGVAAGREIRAACCSVSCDCAGLVGDYVSLR